MPSLLHLDSSADLGGSVSRRLTARFAEAWAAAGTGRTVVRRDLFVDQVPHLPSSALHWAADLRTPAEIESLRGDAAAAAAEARQAELIDEFRAADVLVVGAPMYNWAVPSTLKAWIDHVHVAGVTSPYEDRATQPFAGKPVVVVSSRGGKYGDGSPNAEPLVPGLEQLFAALGMESHVVVAELTLASRIPALAGAQPAAAASQAAAERELDELAARLG